MPVSNEDLAYLSYLIYNHDTAPRKIEKNGEPILSPTGSQYQILDYIETAYGYAGAILKDQSGNIILVHRGTEFDVDTVNDLIVTDILAMGLAQINNQVPAAEALLQEARAFANESGGTFIMTGHSLGGSITQILAAKYQVSGVTFNAFGAVGINDTPADGGDGLVTNYMRATDIVASLGTHYGTVVKYATSEDIGWSVGSLDSWNFSSHDITQFYESAGSVSIMKPENSERYERGKFGYDYFSNGLLFDTALARAAIYATQSPLVENGVGDIFYCGMKVSLTPFSQAVATACARGWHGATTRSPYSGWGGYACTGAAGGCAKRRYLGSGSHRAQQGHRLRQAGSARLGESGEFSLHPLWLSGGGGAVGLARCCAG